MEPVPVNRHASAAVMGEGWELGQLVNQRLTVRRRLDAVVGFEASGGGLHLRSTRGAIFHRGCS